MLSLLYSTVLLYYICFCFVLSCTLLIGGNKEILLLLLYVRQSNKRYLLDLISGNIFTIKITNRKIACVPLNRRK